jgi:uncharacterized protein YcfJ
MESVQQEITMHTIQTAAPARLHPLAIAAAASVTIVCLVGAAAILGWLPDSHGSAMHDTALEAPVQQPVALAAAPALTPVQAPAAAAVQMSATRFQTADGRVFEEVNPAQARPSPQPVYKPAPAPVVHRKVVHHYVQHTAYQPQPQYVQQPSYASQHPVRSYVSDMHPFGTGIGAVVGGVLGNQVGGGNGKKLATVAGVLLGGYAGNEVAHDRNPLPFGGR